MRSGLPPVDGNPIPLPQIPVGGRFKYFLSEWYTITQDPEIIQMVKGMHIDLLDEPVQSFEPRPLQFSLEEDHATDDLVRALLYKNTIEPCSPEPGEFISMIFLRRKPNGSFRMIINLRLFNEYVSFQRFCMETLADILRLIVPQAHMYSIDLTYAYLTIAIILAHRRYLRFRWKNLVYQFWVMPFRSVRISPEIH